MTNPPIAHVVIVGGGTAGWMTAAAASRFLDDGQRRITLIESDAIGTVGVGEATIPPIVGFNALLGIDEADFMAATGATFKLGIEFADWGRIGDRYFHPFGSYGRDIEGLAFHQLWLKLRGAAGAGAFQDYSIAAALARANRFARPNADPRSPLSRLAYAYHFDAGRYAGYLRTYAEAGGVARIEGRIVDVVRDGPTGHVRHLTLADGRTVAGDLFVDCSGFASLLLGDAMGVPFEDWSHWLPCDRAVAMPGAPLDPLPPYTQATAHAAGWRWRIPLQHRTGNGVVYSAAHIGDEAAAAMVARAAGGNVADVAAPIRFRAGRRRSMWEGNVVAIGLAAGFLEPLESTSIHLIQTAISTLFALFPDRRFAAVERTTFNRLMTQSYDRIRDFVILHYHATARSDSAFWQAIRESAPPASLADRIALFRQKGRFFREEDELFIAANWVSVLLGQGIVPNGYDPVVDALDADRVAAALAQMRAAIAASAQGSPRHAASLARQ